MTRIGNISGSASLVCLRVTYVICLPAFRNKMLDKKGPLSDLSQMQAEVRGFFYDWW